MGSSRLPSLSLSLALCTSLGFSVTAAAALVPRSELMRRLVCVADDVSDSRRGREVSEDGSWIRSSVAGERIHEKASSVCTGKEVYDR